MKDKLKDLEEKSIPRLLLSYSITTFAALALNSIYTLVDAVFIGRGVGVDALGGITAALPFTMIQSAVSTMIGGGAAILVSQLLGKGDKKKAGETVMIAALAFWAVALLITVFGLIFIDPLLNILGVAENLKIYAKQYLTILLIATVFSTGFSSVMRAEGKMLFALLQWVIPISVNIILDAVFIYGFHWGVKGAAYATLACQVTSVITAMIYFTKFTSLDFKGAKWNGRTLKDITAAGLPSLIQNGAIAVSMALLNNVFKVIGGEELQTVYGIISKIFMFCIVPFTAITQALQPIAGYNYGAGRPERIRSAMRYTMLFSLIASLIPLILCEVAPKALASIIATDGEVINNSIPALRWTAAAFPFLFLPSAVGVLLQSTGKKIIAALLFAESFAFIPPFAFLFGYFIGAAQVWIAFPVAGAAASAVAAVVLIAVWKRIGRTPTVESPI